MIEFIVCVYILVLTANGDAVCRCQLETIQVNGNKPKVAAVNPNRSMPPRTETPPRSHRWSPR